MPRRSRNNPAIDPLTASSDAIRGAARHLDFTGVVEVLTLLAMGPQDVGAISRYLGRVYPNTSRLLTRLEEAGWIRTTEDRRRRVKHLGAAVKVSRRAAEWQIAFRSAHGAALTLTLPASAMATAAKRVRRTAR